MKRRGPGQPTKLTPQVQRTFVRIIKLSGFYRDACASVGITESTLANWRDRGAAGEEPYLGFFVALRKAETERRLGYLTDSKKRGAKKHDAREIQWRAQVTDPEAFSIKHHVIVQQQLDVAINRLMEVFRDRPNILEEALSAIAGESRSGETGSDAIAARAVDAAGGGAPEPHSLEAGAPPVGVPRPPG